MMVHQRMPVGMSLGELLRDYADDLPAPVAALQVNGLCGDSRRVRPGDLFIASSGLGRPGIEFAAEASVAGALAVLYDCQDAYTRQRVVMLQRQYDLPWIGVDDLPAVTGKLASRFYRHPSRDYRLVGVTGTDGKTSVTHILVQALERLGLQPGSMGTLGYGRPQQLRPTGYTTPDALQLQPMLSELRQQGCEVVVMEVSSHALDQQRVAGCAFDMAVLTNLGQDHLDYHGDLQHYAAAKARLFEQPGLAWRVLNLDDDLGRKLALAHEGKGLIGYSRQGHEAAAIRLVESRMDRHGVFIRVDCQGYLLEIDSGLVGGFNVDNLLAVIAVLHGLDVPPADMERALQRLQPIPGRMEFYPATAGYPAVVIDFAHTEQALESSLASLRDFCRGRLYCVFGCGGDRDRSKRPRMAAVAERLADEVIVTDDNPRNESPEQIMEDILRGFAEPRRVRVIHDRQTAIETAWAQAGEQDLVLVAGKGHEQVQVIGDKHLPFSDQAVVRSLREDGA